MSSSNSEILGLISKCREMKDVVKKSSALQRINLLLPPESRVNLPSLITNDGIDNLLSWIEVRISPPIY
ncbi:MAG TPA: hypothetical protein VH481_03560 [Nitrososphaeraceae archaeon]